MFVVACYIRSCCIKTSGQLFRNSLHHFATMQEMPALKEATGFRTQKIESEEFKSLFTSELNLIHDLFKKNKFELRIAGGAVRDLLLGQRPNDLDFATTATPQEMIDLFERENIRMLNKRGEKHGTVTCRVNDKENFEITTLRIDKICDGRHAEVEFTTDWLLDANRRDLTVNSMFLDLDGTVIDYCGGVEDLKQRRIAFVGNAEQRIKEDFLRILRYFRFYGRLAKTPNNHEKETLDAIKSNVQGLGGISGERIWVELKNIVTGRFAGPVVRTMLDCGVGEYIGLPKSPNIDEFERVVKSCCQLKPRPMTVLSALLDNESEVMALDARMKMSNKERYQGVFIVRHRNGLLTATAAAGDEDQTAAVLTYLKSLIIELTRPSVRLEGATNFAVELAKYAGGLDGAWSDLAVWRPPRFPVDGAMVLAAGGRKGPGVRLALDKLFDAWCRSGYTATVETLLPLVDEFCKVRRSASPAASR